MTKNRILFALSLLGLGLFSSVAAADERRTVVWLTSERTPSDAIRLEAEAAGYRLVVADAPTANDPGSRLSSARSLGRVLGSDFTVLVETQGTEVPTVFVIAADGTIAHAQLSDSRFSQRALALVAMSLVEDLADRPSAPVAASPAPAQPAPETPAPAEAPAQPAPAPAPAPAEPAPTAQDTVPAERAAEDAALAHEVAPTHTDAVIQAPAAQDELPPTVVILDTPPTQAFDAQPATTERVIFFGGDIVPFVGTSTFTRGEATRRLSLNLFVGFDGGLDGFELGGIANIHRRNVRGIQIAGMLNAAGGKMRGVQISGAFNYAGDDSVGLQLSNINFARRSFHGAQLGNVNIAGSLLGAQLGNLNISRGDMRGAQLGMLNIAHGETHGGQLGLVNVANGSHGGVQVGLVNVSRDADFALGLVNIVRDGRTQLEFLGNDGGFIFGAVKHGGRHFHSVYSLGMNPFEEDPIFAAGLGFGVRATPSERVHLDFDAVGHVLVDRHTDDGNGNVESMTSGRILVGIRLVRGLSLVAGASYDVLVTPRDRTGGFGMLDAELLNSPRLTGVDDVRVLGWPSLMLGLQVL